MNDEIHKTASIYYDLIQEILSITYNMDVYLKLDFKDLFK